MKAERADWRSGDRLKMGVAVPVVLVALFAFHGLGVHSASNDGFVLNQYGQRSYGVDISTAVQHSTISTNYAWLPHNVDPDNNPTPPQYRDVPIQPLGKKREFYREMMNGCPSRKRCAENDEERIERNLRQPQSMKNYTELGFAKIKAPKEVYDSLRKFWDTNKQHMEPEKWDSANIHVNHWGTEQPSLLSVQRDELEGGGSDELERPVFHACRDIIEKWTGQKLSETSMYGIRVYKENSVLSTHVDRFPLVSSAIINVAQDVDEEWPLEVYGHDGLAYNITMQPGDMVLYESHSILHGRPFPLKGRYYANVFVHFEPVVDDISDGDEELRNSEAESESAAEENSAPSLPVYIIKGSLEEQHWIENNIVKEDWQNEGFRLVKEDDSVDELFTTTHHAAQEGHIHALWEHIRDENPDYERNLNAKDSNGWEPLHLAARSGHIEAVQLLVLQGADVESLTDHGKGVSALLIAREEHGDDHPVVRFLLRHSGESEEDEFFTVAHFAAENGEVEELWNHIGDENPDRDEFIHAEDRNGWQPLHLAARSGHLEAVKLLLDQGADMDAVTNFGTGETPLDIAREQHGDDHAVVHFFEELDAAEFGSEL